MNDDTKRIQELTAQRADLAKLAGEWKWADAIRNTALLTVDARKAFLVQGTDEDPTDFSKRAELANYAPLVPLISERIEGAVWKRPPTIKTPDALAEFVAKAAPDGRDLSEVTRAACVESLWDRFAVVLVDRPRLAKDAPAPVTKADEEVAGLDKPYCVVYAAPQMLDYRVNRLGLLEYVRLDGPTYGDTREIREIDAAGIVVHRVIKSAGGGERLETDPAVPLADGLRAAGRLPVVPVQYKAIDAMRGRSPLSAALMAERSALQLLSDILWDLWLAGHPTLIVKTVAAELAQIGVGTSKYLKLKPKRGEDEGDSIEYLEAALPGLQKQVERYEATRREIQQQAGVRPISSDQAGGAPESGVAASIKNESEAYVLSNVADMAGDVAWDILSVVALDMGVIAPEALATEISVTYPKDFSLQSADRAMMVALQFRGLLGPAAAATKEAVRRAVLAALDNLDPKLEKEIAGEIEASGAYQPPAPNFEDRT